MNIAHIYTIVLIRYFSFNEFVLMAALPGILFCIVSGFLPESPIWLMKRNDAEAARKSLEKLRGKEYEKVHELNEILDVLNQNKSEELSQMEKLKQLIAPKIFKPLSMMMVLYALQVISKLHLVSFFLADSFSGFVGI